MFFMCHIGYEKNVDIEKEPFQMLSEEITKIGPTGNPIAWMIAFGTNQYSAKKNYDNYVFYTGEQRRRFLVRIL